MCSLPRSTLIPIACFAALLVPLIASPVNAQPAADGDAMVIEVGDDQTFAVELASGERITLSEIDLSGLIDPDSGTCCADPQILVGARLQIAVAAVGGDALEVVLTWLDDATVLANPPTSARLRILDAGPRPGAGQVPQGRSPTPARPQDPTLAPGTATPAPTLATAEPTPSTAISTSPPSATPVSTPDRAAANLNPQAAAPCGVGQIKANSRSKVYHLLSSSSYARGKHNIVCFDTEAQAQAAGYRRSRN